MILDKLNFIEHLDKSFGYSSIITEDRIDKTIKALQQNQENLCDLITIDSYYNFMKTSPDKRKDAINIYHLLGGDVECILKEIKFADHVKIEYLDMIENYTCVYDKYLDMIGNYTCVYDKYVQPKYLLLIINYLIAHDYVLKYEEGESYKLHFYIKEKMRNKKTNVIKEQSSKK